MNIILGVLAHELSEGCRALLKLEVCSTSLKALPPGVSGLCEDTY